MENTIHKNRKIAHRRTLRVRQHLRGTTEKPRLCVVKTIKHIQAQLINDDTGLVLASISTNAKELRQTPYCKKNKASAKVLGEKIAEKAKAIGVEEVVFDRGPFRYHGILAELADAARSNGLQF